MIIRINPKRRSEEHGKRSVTLECVGYDVTTQEYETEDAAQEKLKNEGADYKVWGGRHPEEGGAINRNMVASYWLNVGSELPHLHVLIMGVADIFLMDEQGHTIEHSVNS